MAPLQCAASSVSVSYVAVFHIGFRLCSVLALALAAAASAAGSLTSDLLQLGNSHSVYVRVRVFVNENAHACIFIHNVLLFFWRDTCKWCMSRKQTHSTPAIDLLSLRGKKKRNQ